MCLPEGSLQIQIIDSNKVSFFNNYSLVATINHSGSLNNGHYWVIVKDNTTIQCFSCDNKVVFQIKADDLSKKYHMCTFFVRKRLSVSFLFVFFLSCCFCIRGFVNSGTVFGSDNSTHNPSSVSILSLLTQFSSLTILQSLVSGETLQGGMTKLGLVFEE